MNHVTTALEPGTGGCFQSETHLYRPGDSGYFEHQPPYGLCVDSEELFPQHPSGRPNSGFQKELR